jgi:hypothetical protein
MLQAITDANSSDLYLLVKLFYLKITVDKFIGYRPMRQIQVDIIQLQSLKAFCKGLTRPVSSHFIGPKFFCDKQIFAVDTGFFYGGTVTGFISVNCRGINMAITALESS